MRSGRMCVWMSTVRTSAMGWRRICADTTRDLDEAWIDLHHMTALAAGAQGLVAVEVAEARQEVLLDVMQHKAVLVQEVVALLAVPLQAILQRAVGTLHLDHQPHRARAAPRLVRHTRGQQEHLALADRDRH